ncbi:MULTISPECIES: ClpXP protease specificity-enhancing factor [unclassified Thioalkalivibrio]|uniref:ClpXP protease specificity-enhancing factor n=1 Tax=unclassified Thioalkalivibrio TaxID=2621013 RepID=UPI00037AB889|nr:MULTISPECIES: ClpXP protease specificity-enhancing factor [unclassified Thioalkalivibrio]
MTSSRPYLLRALWEWITDNGFTPHILVDATVEGTLVPDAFVEQGKITLNIGPSAVQALNIGDEAVAFSARFAGNPMDVYVPTQAVLAVYARENGQGMMFGSEPGPGPEDGPGGDGPDDSGPSGSDQDGDKSGAKRKGPALKVVK